MHRTVLNCTALHCTAYFITCSQAQMVRRVKAYLKCMRVITDEEELHKMSMECEPPQGGFPPPPAIATVTKPPHIS